MRTLLLIAVLLGSGCTQTVDPGDEPNAPNFLRLQSWAAVSADGLAAEGFLRWVYLADDPLASEAPREYCEIWERLDLARVVNEGCPACTDVWAGTATVDLDQATCLDVSWSERALGLGFGRFADAGEDIASHSEDGFTHAVYMDWAPDEGDLPAYEALFVATPERWSSETAPIGASGDRPVAGDYAMECLYFWDVRE
jgi:hypothetical protein